MRLRSLIPPLPAGRVSALEECGIKTDTDLLFSGTPADIYRKLPEDAISLHELSNCVTQVAALVSAPAIRGDEFLALATKRYEDQFGEDVKSGVPQLDELLGGFGRSKVLEISGDRGSGKTALALQLVLSHLCCNPDSGALWIDTTGEFSIDRAPMMLQTYSEQRGKHTALERLQVALAFELDAVHEVLESLRASLNPEPDSGLSTVRCIVIDSITPIFRPLLSIVSSQGHAAMIAFMRQLRTFAETFSLNILVLNATSDSSPRNPYSAFGSTKRKPALGPSFTYTTDATLWLARHSSNDAQEDIPHDDQGSIHIAEVLRSKITRSRTWCSFKVRNGVLLAK